MVVMVVMIILAVPCTKYYAVTTICVSVDRHQSSLVAERATKWKE